MVFKQGILREEKMKFFVGNLCILVPFFVLTAIFAFKSDNISGWLLFSLLTFWPLFVAALLISVHQLEWFSVYHDRIGVRNIFGLKNTVFYENVQFVEEREIPLTSRGTYKTFYIFVDGRKNRRDLYGRRSCYNSRKYSLLIYKTPELENYILNVLHLEVKKS